MASLIWSEKAAADLENIYDFIAADSPFYAKVQIERIVGSAERLKSFPGSGRAIPEIPHLPHQELIIGAYRLVYRFDAESETVYIATVIHSARLMQNELLE